MKNKRYSLKVPQDIKILYCNKRNIITIVGPLTRKSIKLKLKIRVEEKEKIILILPEPTEALSNNKKKSIKALQGTHLTLIKQLFIETSITLYKKIKFIGIGYRAFDVENFVNQLFLLKLGYSHPIYFKKPADTNIFCLKLTKLFIFGNSYQQITQLTSLIRSLKLPEPYKGKGILYENETILLKEGKKI